MTQGEYDIIVKCIIQNAGPILVDSFNKLVTAVQPKEADEDKEANEDKEVKEVKGE